MTRARDALAAERRRMPWLAVEKAYEFDGPEGKASLLDLFEGRRQLIVYRAFFEPGVFGWPEHACRGCSMVADQVAHLAHLNARDTTLVVRLARAAGGHRAPEGADGLGDALVHHHRRLRRRLRRGRVARHQRLHPRRRPGVPHLLHQQPRRRGDGQHLELPRHHRARPPGGVGGFARRLSADPDRTNGGTGTTATSPTPRPTRNGSRCRTPERPPFGNAKPRTNSTSNISERFIARDPVPMLRPSLHAPLRVAGRGRGG